MSGHPLPGLDHSETFEELAVGWALHALEPEDAEVFLPHLEGCPRCRQVVDETTEVMAAMATMAPSAEPPQTLRDRLREEVASTPQDALPEPATVSTGAARVVASGEPTLPPAVVPGPVPVPRRRWTSALVAAALVAVVSLGGWTAVLLGDRNEARQTAATDAAMVEAMLRPGPATVVPVADDAGRTVATLLARDDGVQLVSHGLEANDREAETYVLWGLDQGTPKPLGTFDVTGSGLQLSTMAVGDADTFPSYGISIEPGRRAPDAPTDVVARGSLPS